MVDSMKNLLIGIFVLTAIAIIAFMITFLHPSSGDDGLILRVRFTDIDKVTVGTRVLFAGKPIGEVVDITELDDMRSGRTERNGDIYVYELKLAVDSSTKIYNTDVISLRTSGLLGEKSISIDPEPLQPGQELRIVNNDVLYAEGTGSVEDTFKEFKEVADKFDVTLDLISDALRELHDRDTWINLAKAVENISDMSGNLRDAWGDIDESIVNIADATANIKEVTDKVVAGDGTLGKLLSNDELYLRLTSLFNKGEVLFDDINHYGILFHLDKGWQRLRARRLNLLQKLSTPQEFRNYFNDEIDQVQTSLSRVSVVLDKSRCYPNLMDDRDYQKVFAELMRRVEGLEEALKMYNTQAMECEVQKTELAEGIMR